MNFNKCHSVWGLEGFGGLKFETLFDILFLDFEKMLRRLIFFLQI